MSSLLTDLLTASADAQGQLSSQSERSKLTLQVELCWSCVRLGFSGSLGLTMPQDVARPMDLVLRDAFECGLRLRNGHGERLKAAQFVSPPKGKAALRSLPHGSAADTLATP